MALRKKLERLAGDVEEQPGNAGGTTDSQPPALKSPVDIRSAALTVVATLLVILVLQQAQEVLIPIVLAVLISYALDPLVWALTKRRVPRGLAAILVLAAALGAAGATAYSLSDEAMAIVEELPQAARQFRREWQDSRRHAEPGPIEKVQKAATEIEKTAAATAPEGAAPRGVMRVQIEEPAFRASDYLWWGSVNAAAFAGQATLILFLVYFLLLSGDGFKRRLVKIAGPTLTRKKITVQILDEINARIERFLAVQVATSLIVAAATWLALSWLGLENAAIWGLVAGVFNSIPYFGPVIVTGGLSVVAYLQFEDVGLTAMAAGIALVITSLEGWLLTPALMGRAASMSPVAIFIGLLFWSWVWGVWGMILAVPMLMIIKAICDYIEDLMWIGELLGE
jgi:predicted PurR-regulated permease PerM